MSIFLLSYVFHKVGWQDLWKELSHVNLSYLTLYMCLAFLMTLVSVIKWLILVKPQGISVSVSRLFRLYLVGYCFNNVLPTNVGGDVIRAYELGKSEGKTQQAVASIFMERFTGLTTLIFFALLALSLDQRYLQDIRLVVALALVLVGYLGIVSMVFNPSFLLFLKKRIPVKIVQRTIEKVQNVQQAIFMYKHHRLDILYAMGCSIAFYFSAVLVIYVGCLVFDVHVPLSNLFTAVPIMYIVFMIPISLGGIGLQEWAYYVVLGLIGVPSAVALSLGLLCRAQGVAFSVVGGATYPSLRENGKLKDIDRLESSRVDARGRTSLL